MPIIINIDVMLARRKMSSGELAEKVGITPANLSILKCGKAKAIRITTMEAICRALAARRRPSGSPRWKPSAAPSTASRATFWSTGRKRPRPDKPSESREGSAETLRGLSFCLKMCKFAHSNK